MADEQQDQTPTSGGGLLKTLMIAGFVGIVILAECVLAYLWIPSAEEIAAMAEERMTRKLHELNPDEENPQLTDNEKLVEVEFGEYSVTAPQPATHSALRVDFKLAGTVKQDNQEQVKQLYERHQYRFASNVEYVIRNAEVSDLNDPGLGLIKRRILETSNRLFGEPMIKEILVSGFSLVEH